MIIYYHSDTPHWPQREKTTLYTKWHKQYAYYFLLLYGLIGYSKSAILSIAVQASQDCQCRIEEKSPRKLTNGDLCVLSNNQRINHGYDTNVVRSYPRICLAIIASNPYV